jgi:hypothetical protein
VLSRIPKSANGRLRPDTSFDHEGSQIMTTLSGKTARATGALRGTGRASAFALAKVGAQRAFRQTAARGAGKNRQPRHASLAGLGVGAASIGLR